MTLSGSLVARRLGVAVSALTLGIGMATPVYAAPAKDKTDCIDYGQVAEAPAGFIPRDDLHTVHKDPLARALKSVTSATGKGGKAGAAAAEEFAGATIPVRFNVVYKDNGQGGGNLSDARINEQIEVLNEAYKRHRLHVRPGRDQPQGPARVVQPGLRQRRAAALLPRQRQGGEDEAVLLRGQHLRDAEHLHRLPRRSRCWDGPTSRPSSTRRPLKATRCPPT